jgi:hypothetical protein
MAVVGAAPCPMLLAGRSPDRVAGAHRAARDLHPTDARDDVSVWPIGWVCQVVRGPGSNVTSAVASRAGDPVRGHPARRRRPGCEHRDLILTGEYVRSSRGGGGQISGVLSPRTGGPGSYAKVWNSIRKAHPRRRPCAFVYVCFRGNSGHRISSGRTFPLASSERCRSASLRSVLLICAFSTACMCRVSTQITGNSASARALNSHCDNGPASSPIRLKW